MHVKLWMRIIYKNQRRETCWNDQGFIKVDSQNQKEEENHDKK